MVLIQVSFFKFTPYPSVIFVLDLMSAFAAYPDANMGNSTDTVPPRHGLVMAFSDSARVKVYPAYIASYWLSYRVVW